MTVLAEIPQPSPAAPQGIEEPEPYTSREFARLAQAYPDLRMERTKEGEIIIMPPAFSETGRKNSKINARLVMWAEQNAQGETFDSSAGFTLSNGAERSPDACWIERSRWEALTVQQREEQFAPLCPDFVIELRSKTDRLSTLQTKMQEYRDNGARLGWLIDPQGRRVEVYRPGQDVLVLQDAASVSGDPELPGFTLELSPLW